MKIAMLLLGLANIQTTQTSSFKLSVVARCRCVRNVRLGWLTRICVWVIRVSYVVSRVHIERLFVNLCLCPSLCLVYHILVRHCQPMSLSVTVCCLSYSSSSLSTLQCQIVHFRQLGCGLSSSRLRRYIDHSVLTACPSCQHCAIHCKWLRCCCRPASSTQ